MTHIIILEVIQLFELMPKCVFVERKVGQYFINRHIYICNNK